ncbi:sigma-70 family RNA polymerase sigma factor [Sphingobacterium humi]|uniref:Sigma-70 family RNA polymerase sigma factor n=1 Tax=Sphingobacterium humi TaxID=1796905 RepID=A0A6N8KX91_9SPHI|nr:sigma-70 family RNA polymerase sigma factor [Sphingobacterium humi]MVZ62045.1 sigma-70 family RNA polymerase sigma factor [Sphingobacterium humi]
MQANEQSIWLQQLKLGNTEALSAIYRFYADQVYAVAYSFLKDEGWSQDVVQDVFWKFWETRERVDPQANLWNLLFVMSKHRSLNKLREIKNAKASFDRLLLNCKNKQAAQQEFVYEKELIGCIERAKKSFTTQQLLVFELCKINGLTYAEAGEKLNIAPNTVKNHMVQSLKILRKHLKNAGYLSFFLLILK